MSVSSLNGSSRTTLLKSLDSSATPEASMGERHNDGHASKHTYHRSPIRTSAKWQKPPQAHKELDDSSSSSDSTACLSSSMHNFVELASDDVTVKAGREEDVDDGEEERRVRSSLAAAGDIDECVCETRGQPVVLRPVRMIGSRKTRGVPIMFSSPEPSEEEEELTSGAMAPAAPPSAPSLPPHTTFTNKVFDV
ncbi:hypothetical protein GUITHDRAFT_110515 [Guillardia theta CCMP2712]|uniref:Uncharacterized protein n=1 Tax=Guillardia theta (strain CCMP2712) TaxID=905079 RepID=L1J4E2_GUITC|nr:hypothetical protein GUITHDRAFT_110515 [Guillardia theta CCMP2712]EKX43393.1 hypothetical protein GUITHDRAFT_110515 [Guillardia theta CCMP2712]|eukprot:XP_005830373.1 hypothetical protein GUITHDRAFT_110515 [Guillardia theta CCMP2712]